MAYQAHIDWMWGDTNPCGRPICLTYVVWNDPYIVRGPLSARQCVQACMASALINMQMAVEWLCAGQAHNPDARREMREAGALAVAYAIAQYGPFKADLKDFITSPSIIMQHLEGCITTMNKVNITWEDLGQQNVKATAGESAAAS